MPFHSLRLYRLQPEDCRSQQQNVVAPHSLRYWLYPALGHKVTLPEASDANCGLLTRRLIEVALPGGAVTVIEVDPVTLVLVASAPTVSAPPAVPAVYLPSPVRSYRLFRLWS